MNFLFVCAYAAPYKGNFISSIENLERELKKRGHKVIYAFIEKARNQDWCKEIQQRTKVYFLEPSRFKLKTYKKIKEIYKKENIDVVHSHFELYDIPIKIMATKKIKIFWHLHDAIDYQKEDILHKVLNKLQYKYLSKNVKLISVCDYYRKQILKLGMEERNTQTVLNGIDTNRINRVQQNRKIEYDFYTFGWNYYIKGVDIILKACEKLHEDNREFKLLLNGNEITWKEIDKLYKNDLPKWLIKQEFIEDINETIKKVGCFIQASRSETFSYAIGEMAYAGLDIISSKIEGTKWAEELPTVEFFEYENVNELYNLMMKNLKEKSINESKCQISKKIIEEQYSLENWTNNILRIYNVI